jgi:hypothetical protein
MRKGVLEHRPTPRRSDPNDNWLDVETLASVQVTSEDPAFPIECVFSNNGGWRAAQEGEQVIRLVFDEPQTIHRIWLHFSEDEIARTQQFTLRWSGPGAQTLQEIVRQQWNFNPGASTAEFEDYRVDLSSVSTLELTIHPEITAGKAVATLGGWRVA